VKIDPQDDPESLQRGILKIPGTVDTGLFLGMADAVFVEHPATDLHAAYVQILSKT
jgi:ribose 5-phosphate isomerase